ncbi:TetR/AcrR family transcriptional regulator [Nakamurella deserti]|uniref:TetR/AcrR family transcriptional regulator n=1 Tax=Nakamurella deserti TaxID=2164074 RepID=UPI000DBE9387|nr:TetR/AcrR family transcriptional regulator [Nakamurella deserti]
MTTSATPPGGRRALVAAAHAELAEHGRSAISLRAVARRAGVSHAAPKHHFGDRAGLLTAVATDGFDALADTLRRILPAEGPPTAATLAELGRAYIDFGLAHPALFDLMFRPSELRGDDPDLIRAERAAIGVLSDTVAGLAPDARAPGTSPDAPSAAALSSWALVHGLVVLTRDGALPGIAGVADPAAAARLAHDLLLSSGTAATVAPPDPPLVP